MSLMSVKFMNYETQLRDFLPTIQPADIITEIPGGSGVFNVANVPPPTYSRTWVSWGAGRFSPSGEPAKFYATNFDICMSELGFPPGTIPTNVVFEAGETKNSFTVIDVHRLPEAIRNPLYADKNPATKWDMSHLFMDIVNSDDRYSGVAGAYYQSASGQMLQIAGSCLLLTSEMPPINIIATGDYWSWKAGMM